MGTVRKKLLPGVTDERKLAEKKKAQQVAFGCLRGTSERMDRLATEASKLEANSSTRGSCLKILTTTEMSRLARE